ncbi:alternative sulfate transporter [Plectosphaerella plurivora]|uniref:Alternative sulfate transporter n=1 Tax=Plectosphaerella plurivora TaxID=936078 RepID=A0A9P9A5Z7_9PEZI|nr:alternative sulfate transporter [Plectosphaerella plurivora]
MESVSDEKYPKHADGELSGSESPENDALTWTQEEETALVRKIDLLLMPLLTLGFFALQLDRGNIGNALTDNFFKDVGITQNQFNTGQQLLSLGIILLEIPSNLVLYRVGPTLWIGGQIIAWGFVATFQAFQHGLGAFMATRLLLGLTEAGFIPAALFTITRWYKRDEISKRFSWFFLGNMIAAAISGIIAYGILHMRGVAGLAGWQWLFIIEGIFTILVGVAFLATFPESAANPVSLLRHRYFTDRETQILSLRVLRDDPSKAHTSKNVKWSELKSAITNWRLIPHVCFTFLGLASASAFGSYAPSLVVSFGYGKLESNALVSIGYWALIFFNLLTGWIADRIGVRGPIVSITFFIGMIFSIANRALVFSDNAHLKFGILIMSIAVGWPWHPVNGSWLSLNAKSAGERSITMAIHIMAANCSGLIGKQIFRSEDAPLYPKGFTLLAGLFAAAFVLSIIANLQYYFLNGRKLARKGLTYMY